MNTLLIINKTTFEIIEQRQVVKGPLFEKQENSKFNFEVDIIELVRDLDELNNIMKPSDDCIVMKLDSGLTVAYRKNQDNDLAVILICQKKAFKKHSLNIITKNLLNTITLEDLVQKVTFNVEEFCSKCIEDLTVKFIDYLRSNKLFPKFIYFNYNPSAVSSIDIKKLNLPSSSIILYNPSKEMDKEKELKDTNLQKSTIKEKELNIDTDKKQNNPSFKKIFIKKYNNIKKEQYDKKGVPKAFASNNNSFIDKYFLNKGTMIHMLFNNAFIESPNDGNSLKDNLSYPINETNDHVLLFILDLYNKAQQMFSVKKGDSIEYLDVVNYIELNLVKSGVLLKKNKLNFIKFKNLFIVIQIEIYEDKNLWATINSNTNFYKEMEFLFSMLYAQSHPPGE